MQRYKPTENCVIVIEVQWVNVFCCLSWISRGNFATDESSFDLAREVAMCVCQIRRLVSPVKGLLH